MVHLLRDKLINGQTHVHRGGGRTLGNAFQNTLNSISYAATPAMDVMASTISAETALGA